MIEFSCACGQYRFSLADEMAEGLIQCPRCRRLVDIPAIAELSHIAEDGGYKLGDDDEFEIAPVTRAGPVTRVSTAPKYDPVTGQLIRPLAIRDEAPQPVLPIGVAPKAAKNVTPTLHYSAVAAVSTVSVLSVFIALLRPANLVVFAFVVLAHFIAQVTASVTVFGFIFVFVLPLLLGTGMIGHFGNVIDETGPNGHDELPAPLRNAGINEDITTPCIQILIAIGLAYLPALAMWQAHMDQNARWSVTGVLVAFGTLIAPALMLTTVTSGTWANLRPDRVVGTIVACGARYVLPVLTFAVAIALYSAGVYAGQMTMLTLFPNPNAGKLAEVVAAYIVLAGGIYMMHAACWQLGLLYRAYHELFPWIMQRHISTRTGTLPSQSRAPTP